MIFKKTLFIPLITIYTIISGSISFAATEVNNSLNTLSGSKSQVELEKKQLEIKDIWARKPLSPTNNSAAYMKIHNPTNKEYVIIGASAADTANSTELHKSFIDENGVSKMTFVNKIVIPANSDIEFAPGGLHIMLMEIKKSLNYGDKFTILLKFENLPPMKLEAEIK